MNNGNGAEASEIVNDGMEKLAKVEKAVKAKAVKADAKLSSMADSASEDLDEGMDDIRTRFEAFEAKLHNGTDRLLENVRALGDATSKQLNAHPLIAVGVAFLAGMAVLRLVRR